MYNGYCCKLMDKEYGPGIMARLLRIAENINPYQMSDLLSKLPQGVLEELWQYTEYAQIRVQLNVNQFRQFILRPGSHAHRLHQYRMTALCIFF